MNANLKRILGLDNVKRTPIESCIHGEYKEGSLGLTYLAATELADIITERDEAVGLIDFLKAVIKDQNIPFTTETCAVIKKHIERVRL